MRAVDVHDFHGFLPAFQAVDVSRTDRARAEAAGDAVLRVEGKVRSGFGAQRPLEQHLHAGPIEPRRISPSSSPDDSGASAFIAMLMKAWTCGYPRKYITDPGPSSRNTCPSLIAPSSPC